MSEKISEHKVGVTESGGIEFEVVDAEGEVRTWTLEIEDGEPNVSCNGPDNPE